MAQQPSPQQPIPQQPSVVVFDIGRVLVEWSIRGLYAKLIDDPARLDWFLAHVVSEEWHAQHDAGVPLADMIAARTAQFPAQAELIAAYQHRWLETVPGPVAVIVVDHGSRRDESNRSFESFVAASTDHLPYPIVAAAHMELAEPSIGHAFDRCVAVPGADPGARCELSHVVDAEQRGLRLSGRDECNAA